MRLRSLHRVSVLLTGMLLCTPTVALQGPVSLLRQVTDGSGLHPPVGVTMRIQARVRMETSEGPRVGSYLGLFASGPHRLRQQVTVGGYREVQLEREGARWRQSSLGLQPPRIREVATALRFWETLDAAIGEDTLSPSRDGAEGERCFESDGVLLCLEPSLPRLVRLEREGILYTFTDYAPREAGEFPRTIRVQGDGRPRAEIRVDAVGDYEAASDDLFELPDGATWAEPDDPGSGLDRVEVIELVTPEYPESARRAGIEGEVVVEAIINADGSVSEPVLVRGLAHEELNLRALQAALRCRYEPPTRSGLPASIVARITSTFRIH